jgi:hypothetical protein
MIRQALAATAISAAKRSEIAVSEIQNAEKS